MEYLKVQLHEICDSVDYGYTASATTEPIGPRFLRITDIVPSRLDWESVPFCRIEKKKMEKNRLYHGDIVIARTGATTGWAKYIKTPPEAVFASYLVRFRLNKSVDKRFIGFIVESQVYKDFIKQNIGGSAQPNANAKILASFPTPLPPLPIQRRIATILSAYDDLIENNTRRIQILEQMAQTIYREWFVHFRFPGYEKVKLVESPLGKIPEGWRACSIGEVTFNYDSKRRPLSSMQRAEVKGIFPYYGAAKVLDYINDFIFDGKYLLIAEDGSVITPQRRPVIQLTQGKFWPNNHTHVIQGKQPISTNFLYLLMSEIDISGYITGAAQPKITQANLNRIPVIVPPIEILHEFDLIACNKIDLIQNLEVKNTNLRQTRDLLLPKLMSGELDVSELNIQTGEQSI